MNGIQLIPTSKTQISYDNEVQANQRVKRDDELLSKTSVVSHEFPLTEENLLLKPKKEDLHTFAELTNDPKASFPPLFTICSTIMTTAATKSSSSFFFSILGKGGNNYLNAFLAAGMESLGLLSGLFYFKPKGNINRVFPEQWISSCLAVNTESGLLQWVLDTRLMANVTIEAIRQSAPEHPSDLSGRLLLELQHWILGAKQCLALAVYKS